MSNRRARPVFGLLCVAGFGCSGPAEPNAGTTPAPDPAEPTAEAPALSDDSSPAASDPTATELSPDEADPVAPDGAEPMDLISDPLPVPVATMDVPQPVVNACTETAMETEALDVVLLFAIDTSGSMVARPIGEDVQTKIDSLKYTLEDTVRSLPPPLHVGLLQFPGDRDEPNVCEAGEVLVPVGELGPAVSVQRTVLELRIENLKATGNTPTYGAFLRGVESLNRLDTSELSNVRRYIALITDGRPDRGRAACGFEPNEDGTAVSFLETNDGIEREIAAAAEAGIGTFVVGSPGSETFRGTLSRFASAGSTAIAGCSHEGPNYCHIDISQSDDFATALAQALGDLTSGVLTCNYEIPELAPDGQRVDRERINVRLDVDGAPEEVLLNTNAECDEGWFFSGDEVQLCESTCSRVQNARAVQLNLLFGCETRAIAPPR